MFRFKCTTLQWSLAFFKQRAVLHQEMVIKVTCSTACEITALPLSRHIPGNWFYGYIKFLKLQLYSIMTENYRQESTAASSYTLLRIKTLLGNALFHFDQVPSISEGLPFSLQISSSWNINVPATLSIHPLNPHVLPTLQDLALQSSNRSSSSEHPLVLCSFWLLQSPTLLLPLGMAKWELQTQPGDEILFSLRTFPPALTFV